MNKLLIGTIALIAMTVSGEGLSAFKVVTKKKPDTFFDDYEFSIYFKYLQPNENLDLETTFPKEIAIDERLAVPFIGPDYKQFLKYENTSFLFIIWSKEQPYLLRPFSTFTKDSIRIDLFKLEGNIENEVRARFWVTIENFVEKKTDSK
jgi:hypothetical protein